MFLAWNEFKRGKTKKADVRQFTVCFKENIINLQKELIDRSYEHSPYQSFYVKDPKLRHIHKACVKDRLLHHAIFRVLYPIFDKGFIFDSYSCRNDKGTHRAVIRLNDFARKISKNNTKNCFFLKCDIKKFFDSIDQEVLLSLLKNKIHDEDTLRLLRTLIKSFDKGLPLGNITSQLFANIYLNELDQFVKHILKIKYYIRYCDDLVILSIGRFYLENLILKIDYFLKNNLKLSLHPNKIIIRKFHQGVDFLGYVSFPYHRTLRIKTKKRMIKKIKFKMKQLKDLNISKESFYQTMQSYFGMLKHCNSYKVKSKITSLIFSENRLK